MTMIADARELKALAASLAAERSISVDLEADSLHHYREKVCLLQVTTPHRNILVDTLALRDLTPLRPVFADPSIRKVFHSGDYDLRSLWRDFRIDVRGLFDTQIAA